VLLSIALPFEPGSQPVNNEPDNIKVTAADFLMPDLLCSNQYHEEKLGQLQSAWNFPLRIFYG